MVFTGTRSAANVNSSSTSKYDDSLRMGKTIVYESFKYLHQQWSTGGLIWRIQLISLANLHHKIPWFFVDFFTLSYFEFSKQNNLGTYIVEGLWFSLMAICMYMLSLFFFFTLWDMTSSVLNWWILFSLCKGHACLEHLWLLFFPINWSEVIFYNSYGYTESFVGSKNCCEEIQWVVALFSLPPPTEIL